MSSSESEISEDEQFVPEPILVKDFRSHVEKLQKCEYDDYSGLETEFHLLETQSLRNGLEEEFNAAVDVTNRTKNRYANVLPPDRTRVILNKENDSDSDYINANYISGCLGSKTYIASQGPLKNTVDDFWKMVWEEKCDIIVMLTKAQENGRLKCHNYWPEKLERYGNLCVTLESMNDDPALIERTFKIKHETTHEERTIIHFQFVDWPDHGLPSCAIKFREMLHKVEDLHTNESPILVHCSAGIGRTGTFCTVDYILKDLKRKEDLKNATINVPETVLRLRDERTGMVQTQEQYEFCYLAILEEIESWKY